MFDRKPFEFTLPGRGWDSQDSKHSANNLLSELNLEVLHTPSPPDRICTSQCSASPLPADQVFCNTPYAPSPTSPARPNPDIAGPDQRPKHPRVLAAQCAVYRLRHKGLVSSERRSSERCDATFCFAVLQGGVRPWRCK